MARDVEGSDRRDSRVKITGRRVGYALLTLAVLMPWPVIVWGRAQRSSSAPVILEEVWLPAERPSHARGFLVYRRWARLPRAGRAKSDTATR